MAPQPKRPAAAGTTARAQSKARGRYGNSSGDEAPKQRPKWSGRHELRARGNPGDPNNWTTAVKPPAGSWAIVPVAAACDPRLGGGPLRVLVVICKYRDARTGDCWPKVETIAALLGINRRTVQKHIQTLIDCGHLGYIPQRRISGGGWASNRYMPYFRALPELPAGLESDASQDDATAPTTDPDPEGAMRHSVTGVASQDDATRCVTACRMNRPVLSDQMLPNQSAARLFSNGHEEDGTATPSNTRDSAPVAPPIARRWVYGRELEFPVMTGWLHAAIERQKPGAMTPEEIDRLLIGYRLTLGGGFEDDEATARLKRAVEAVLSEPLPEVSPLDALGVVVNARDARAALHDLQRGMGLGAAHAKHCQPRPS